MTRQPTLVMGEAIENAHSAPCEAAAGTVVSNEPDEKRTASVGGASAQVQADGLNAETFAKLRQYLSDVKSCGTVNERIVAHTALSIIAKQTPSSTDSTRGASNG